MVPEAEAKLYVRILMLELFIFSGLTYREDVEQSTDCLVCGSNKEGKTNMV